MRQQEEKWIALVKQRGSLTNREAIINYIMSPTKVIRYLKKHGFKITHIREKTNNSHYYRYFLYGVV